MATRKTTSKKKATALTDKQMADIAAISFEPVMTKDEVFAAEARYEKTWGLSRRIAMMTLTRTREELIDGFADDPEFDQTLMEMIDHIEHYENHLKAGAEMAGAAIARLACVMAARGEIERSREVSHV